MQTAQRPRVCPITSPPNTARNPPQGGKENQIAPWAGRAHCVPIPEHHTTRPHAPCTNQALTPNLPRRRTPTTSSIGRKAPISLYFRHSRAGPHLPMHAIMDVCAIKKHKMCPISSGGYTLKAQSHCQPLHAYHDAKSSPSFVDGSVACWTTSREARISC